MAYQPNQQGTNPQGSSTPIPVGGRRYSSTTPLGSNASVTTGWMDTLEEVYARPELEGDRPEPVEA